MKYVYTEKTSIFGQPKISTNKYKCTATENESKKKIEENRKLIEEVNRREQENYNLD